MAQHSPAAITAIVIFSYMAVVGWWLLILSPEWLAYTTVGLGILTYWMAENENKRHSKT